jgi:glycerol-3-phosphate acyltransferase PlsX
MEVDDVLAAQKILKVALAPFNYERVGGIPFLGVNGVSLVGHGGSSPLAIKNMIKAAISCVKNDVNGKIVASLN